MQALETVETHLCNPSQTQFAKLHNEYELFRIYKKLQTAYPLEHNDTIVEQGNISWIASIDIIDIATMILWTWKCIW